MELGGPRPVGAEACRPAGDSVGRHVRITRPWSGGLRTWKTRVAEEPKECKGGFGQPGSAFAGGEGPLAREQTAGRGWPGGRGVRAVDGRYGWRPPFRRRVFLRQIRDGMGRMWSGRDDYSDVALWAGRGG